MYFVFFLLLSNVWMFFWVIMSKEITSTCNQHGSVRSCRSLNNYLKLVWKPCLHISQQHCEMYSEPFSWITWPVSRQVSSAGGLQLAQYQCNPHESHCFIKRKHCMKLYESLGNRMLIQFSPFLIMKFKWPDWFYWKSEHSLIRFS